MSERLNQTNPATVTSHRSGAKRVLLEATLVAAAGLVLSLAANAVSPRGLSLISSASTETVTTATSSKGGLRNENFVTIDTARAAALFQDPRYDQGSILFVDARDEARYGRGHIPGASLFDPYRSEKYYAAVLSACRTAEEIVVYCSGGSCEDSHVAAALLHDAGVTAHKLRIYAGGISEWSAKNLPLERGEPRRKVAREKAR